jgi:hypothetical protein
MERKFKSLSIDKNNFVFVNGVQTSLRTALIDLGRELQAVYDEIFKSRGSQVIELLSAYIYSEVKPCEILSVLSWLYEYYRDACVTLERKGAEFGSFTEKPKTRGKIIEFPSPARAGNNTAFISLREKPAYTAKQAWLVRWEEDNAIHTHFTCMGCNANTMVIEEKGRQQQVCEGFADRNYPKYKITIPASDNEVNHV